LYLVEQELLWSSKAFILQEISGAGIGVTQEQIQANKSVLAQEEIQAKKSSSTAREKLSCRWEIIERWTASTHASPAAVGPARASIACFTMGFRNRDS
jgi:hypothetical protein